MNYEFEYRYYGYNKKKLIDKIVLNNGKIINNSTIIKNIVLKGKNKMYHRLRTSDNKNFKYTQKIQNFKKFDKEIEMKIEDTDEVTLLKIFKNISLNEKYRVEKKREKWIIPPSENIKNSIEVIFDIYPGAPEYCEIEAKTLDELHYIENILKLKKCRFKGGMKYLMKKVFGINYNNIDFKENSNNITFTNIKILRNNVTKNFDKFNEMFD
tara:strand:- start:1894 stop:2526 length:633 start_codon:yes stop_codon:yes gene_type:complete